MSTFEDRQNAFENKFAHDAEMRFKAEARRNKKIANWAAGLLGVDPADYTRALIKADMEEAGFEDVIRKLLADIGDKASEEDVRAKVAELDLEAKDEILNESE